MIADSLATLLLALAVALAVFVEGEAKLLDGGDDDLVGPVVGEQAADEGGGVGVGLNAALLETVELLARLPVEILAVYDEEALVDGGLSRRRVEALNDVRVLPLPVVCQM